MRSKLAETTKDDQVYYFLTIAAAKHTSVHTAVCVVFQFYHQWTMFAHKKNKKQILSQWAGFNDKLLRRKIAKSEAVMRAMNFLFTVFLESLIQNWCVFDPPSTLNDKPGFKKRWDETTSMLCCKRRNYIIFIPNPLHFKIKQIVLKVCLRILALLW